MCSIVPGGPWYATMDEADWPFENVEAVEAIKADFEVVSLPCTSVITLKHKTSPGATDDKNWS